MFWCKEIWKLGALLKNSASLRSLHEFDEHLQHSHTDHSNKLETPPAKEIREVYLAEFRQGHIELVLAKPVETLT